jgi:toxin ParE1/3/4
MGKYQLTNKALEDLTAIWHYTTEKWSEKQADKYYELLIDHCRQIADNPGIGKNYEGVIDNLLGLKVNRHIIFYRITPERIIEITRILHGRMDLKNRSRE